MGDMSPVGKMLKVAGIVMVVVGIFVAFGPKIPWLGKLPGDINIQGKNSSFHFPIATSIILSIILTIILNLFFRGR